MAAIVTDQFRIQNANNFVESIDNPANSYYVFLGLPNPAPATVGFGRSGADLAGYNSNIPDPRDTINNINHTSDTMMFGKKVNSANIRRLIKKRIWKTGTTYEMYRHDYGVDSRSPLTKNARLYDASYYVMNKDYNVYLCIDNGSSGINTTGNASKDEPVFTDVEPSKAGESGDGYIWKYLFSVPPSDIIKFDSTDYISVPNNWLTTDTAQIKAVRDNGDSTNNNNQIKKVYIDKQGSGYSVNQSGLEVNILGDGTGGKVVIDTDSLGKITSAVVSSGGQGYTYGMVDLGTINAGVSTANAAKLIPIIPPSRGHGYDIYSELGTDKVLIYSRFDDTTKDFPVDAKFAQIGIVKNPTQAGSAATFVEPQYSSLSGIKFSSVTGTLPTPGTIVRQTVAGGTAKGYTASYDEETMVLKYFQDRSLYFNSTSDDQQDYVGVSTNSKINAFNSSASDPITTTLGFSGVVDTAFTESKVTTTGNKVIDLATSFTIGLSSPEINKGSGDILYLDNRPLIARNSRQKEDIKIILEF